MKKALRPNERTLISLLRKILAALGKTVVALILIALWIQHFIKVYLFKILFCYTRTVISVVFPFMFIIKVLQPIETIRENHKISHPLICYTVNLRYFACLLAFISNALYALLQIKSYIVQFLKHKSRTCEK